MAREHRDRSGRLLQPDFTMHPRLSRLGVDFDGGKLDALGGPSITGKIEVDFFNNGETVFSKRGSLRRSAARAARARVASVAVARRASCAAGHSVAETAGGRFMGLLSLIRW